MSKSHLHMSFFIRIGACMRNDVMMLTTYIHNRRMKSLGNLMRAATEGLIPAIMATPAMRKCFDEDEIKELLEGCKRAMNDSKIHGYVTMYFWYGQKPVVEEETLPVPGEV